jgi:hypothetical protein
MESFAWDPCKRLQYQLMWSIKFPWSRSKQSLMERATNLHFFVAFKCPHFARSSSPHKGTVSSCNIRVWRVPWRLQEMRTQNAMKVRWLAPGCGLVAPDPWFRNQMKMVTVIGIAGSLGQNCAYNSSARNIRDAMQGTGHHCANSELKLLNRESQ